MKPGSIASMVCGLVVALISFTAPGWAAPAEKVLYAFQGELTATTP